MRGTRAERRQFRKELKGTDEAEIRKGIKVGKYGGKDSWKREMAREFLKREGERRRAVERRKQHALHSMPSGLQRGSKFEMRLGHWIGIALAIAAFAYFRGC